MPRTHGSLLAIAGLPVALLAGACAHPAATLPSERAELQPGAPELASGRQLTDTFTYRYLVRGGADGAPARDLGAGRIETRVARFQGRDALMLVLDFTGSTGAFHDTSIVTLDGLVPLHESHHLNGRHTLFDFAGGRVVRRVVAPDSAAGERSHDYGRPVFHFNELSAIARAIPLRRDYETTLPLYSQGDDALERDTLRVLGRDSLGVWNVRFADRVIAATFGVDGTTRRIVRYDVVPRQRTGQASWVISR